MDQTPALIPHITYPFISSLLSSIGGGGGGSSSSCSTLSRRFRWPRGLRRGSAATRFLRVRIPPRAWISVCCECCVLSGRGLCDGPTTRPEESYRVWCDCDIKTSTIRKPWPTTTVEPLEGRGEYPNINKF